jgi:hypothetical protein
MLNAEARVATERASRYLAQLCRHAGQMGHHTRPGRQLRAHSGGTPPEVLHTDWSDSRGTIDFGWGRCALRATDDALVLHAEADDEEHLRRIEEGVAGRLERIGRRDGLTVTWHRVDGPAGRSPTAPGTTAAAPQAVARHRGRGGTIALIALVAVVAAVHLGAAGAGLADSAWAGWGLNAVLVLLLVKIVILGGHGLLRHRRRHRVAVDSAGPVPQEADGAAGSPRS